MKIASVTIHQLKTYTIITLRDENGDIARSLKFMSRVTAKEEAVRLSKVHECKLYNFKKGGKLVEVPVA